MWAKKLKNFQGIVVEVVRVYNDTLLDRNVGTPDQIRRASLVLWQILIQRAKQQRAKANRRTQGKQINRKFKLGKQVWVLDTKGGQSRGQDATLLGQSICTKK